MRAVVMGGTGAVGRALLAELDRDPAYTSGTSLARREVEPRGKVRPLVVDPASFQSPRADVAFCCLGTTIKAAGSQEAFRAVDHDLVLRFARGAKAAGARSFHVVSALGADPASRVFYNRVKGEMERDVAAVGFDGACAYRPSLLLAERAERRAGERVGIAVARALAPIIPRKWEGIPVETVARAMSRHAKDTPTGWHVHPSGELWRLAGDAS